MWVEDPVLKSTVFQRHRKPQGRMELLREGVEEEVTIEETRRELRAGPWDTRSWRRIIIGALEPK